MNSDYTIPIVQGTAVPAPGSQFHSQSQNQGQYEYDKAPYLNATTTTTNSAYYGGETTAMPVGRHEQQPNEYRDVPWAVAFVVHLGVVAFLIIASLGDDSNDGNNDNNDNNAAMEFGSYGGPVVFVLLTVLISLGLSTSTIFLMMKYPVAMVKLGLVFSIALAALFALLTLVSGEMMTTLLGIFFFAITICYTCSVWHRIPYAAANLKTALTAVRCNAGLGVVAYLVMAVAFAWSAFWMVGMAGSLATSNNWVVFFLFVSFFWTLGVLTNTVHVTTAGTVGTWWFVPGEASGGCFSGGLVDSFSRATTYSFGSICLGSLLVALIRALRAIAEKSRNDEDSQLLACLIDCILSCIADIIEYFNKWAYVYVGLYGFGYIEAGRNVIQLFQQKGWTTVIADDLIGRVLLMLGVAVGALTGFAGMLLATVSPNLLAVISVVGDNGGGGGDDGGSSALFLGLLIGFLVGLVVCNILMGVVGSAADTVIVCFAESPAEFEANHPGLSHELRKAWIEAWPELSL